MSYESPITIMTKLIQDQTADRIDRIENGIFKAVQDVGIFVDKEELVRALRYNRHQYEKGYHDRDAEIVRCKDCKHGEKANDVYLCGHPRQFGTAHDPDGFCSDGERR